MESIGTRVTQIFKDKSDLELSELQIRFAKFNYELKSIYEKKIKSIENNINDQIIYYGRTAEECAEEKDKILKKYSEEFQKIYEERKVQFLNIENSIADIESNKKIAIVNFYKVVEDRKKFLKTSQYDEYVAKKQRFEQIINTTLVHEEFDKYTKLLEELTDPLEAYQNKMIALLQKYNSYTALSNECVNKLDECLKASIEDFEEIAKFRNESLVVVKKTNFITNFINKILNKFNGNKKFETEVVQKMNAELESVEQTNNVAIETINSQTESILALIEQVRSEINSQFKFVAG